MGGDHEFVTLAVPAEHYSAVLGYLGRLISGEERPAAGIESRGDGELTPSGRIKASSQPTVEWTPIEAPAPKGQARRIDLQLPGW